MEHWRSIKKFLEENRGDKNVAREKNAPNIVISWTDKDRNDAVARIISVRIKLLKFMKRKQCNFGIQ